MISRGPEILALLLAAGALLPKLFVNTGLFVNIGIFDAVEPDRGLLVEPDRGLLQDEALLLASMLWT